MRFHLNRQDCSSAVWLTFAVALAYATALPGDFVWIDHVEIEEGGYRVQSDDDARRLWATSLDTYLERHDSQGETRGGYWRPLYALSISLDWWLWNGNPWLYHLENLAWHVAVVVGLYALGYQLLAETRMGQRIAFWASLLFAVHPLGVHSVTWISGRKDTMCAAFAVASLVAFLHAGNRQARNSRRWWTLAMVGLLGLGLASKELAVVAPLMATLMLLPVAATGSHPEPLRNRRHGFLLLPLWGTVTAYFLFRWTVLGGIGLGADYPADGLVNNVAMAAMLWWHYLGRVLLPWSPSISDAWPIVQQVGFIEGLAIGGLILVGCMLAFGVRRRWLATTGALWYLVWMIPASGLLPLHHYRAERYLYPASWGIMLVITALWFHHIAGRFHLQGRTATSLPCAIVAAFLALTTAHENQFWWNDHALFTKAITQDPDYVEGRLGLGYLALQRQEYECAVDWLATGIEVAKRGDQTSFWSPPMAHTNLGLAYYYVGSDAAAGAEFRRVLELRPQSAKALYHLGLVEMKQGRLAAAERSFRASLRLNAEDILCRSNLAFALLQQGELQPSRKLLEPLVAEQPNNLTNRNNLASVLLAQREFGAAEQHFQILVETSPEDAGLLAKLAWCQVELGQHEAALQNYDRARTKQPNHPAVLHVGRLLPRRE